VDRRVAQGAPASRLTAPIEPNTDALARPFDHRLGAIALGLALVGICLFAYWASGPIRQYNHFVWQAMAFLHGRATIDYPVGPSPSSPGNVFFQDVLPILNANANPSGQGLIPFPPLPAIVLMPFVAIWGLATDERAISIVLGAIDVGIAWWMVGRLRVRLSTRVLTTVFFALGTVFWYAAQLGTTWFFAHIVALAPLLAAVGLAVGADPAADEDLDGVDGGDPADDPTRSARMHGVAERARSLVPLLRRPWQLVDRGQLLAGFLFGLACTARISIAFGAPFFVMIGSGGSWTRRAVSAGLGAALPIGALVAYNLVSTGHIIHPAYDYQYRLEAVGYPSLNYRVAWGIEDPRYLPQNLVIALLEPPAVLPTSVPASLGDGPPLCTEPGAARGLFDGNCPLLLPQDVGMSLFLTSPAYLFALPALRRYGRSRLVTGAAVAILSIGVINLMHFSQGWVQFGYRFSNDFVPFALILVALGIERRGGARPLAIGLVAASVAINFWGVWAGNVLGW
jgi:hypothetical protein